MIGLIFIDSFLIPISKSQQFHCSFILEDIFLRFVDATVCGGCARYINHSCDPNCNTKILSIGDEKKIIVIANRPIKAGEEVNS